MRKFSQPQNPNPTDLRVQRRHKKRAGKVERDTARVFYMRLSQVRLKIQFNFTPQMGVKQAVPYRTGREARYLSVSTE